MSLISVPAAKPQPDLAAYSPSELYLFKQYDRASLMATGSEDAPDFNPAYPVKAWIETDDKGVPIMTPKIYRYFDAVAGKMWLTFVQNPGAFNLAGLKTYPTYVVEPTQTLIFQAGMSPSTVNPASMCLESEIIPIVEEWEKWDGNCRYALASIDPWDYIYPPDEERRVYDIYFHGIPLNAAGFVQGMNAAGVGAPGYWQYPGYYVGYLNPTWVSTKPTSAPDPTGAPAPVPCRDLLANEEITMGMFGQYQISRTDL